MFSQVSGATTLGINGHVITVEVDISRGVTGFNIVGLAAASVREAKERVRAAIQNSGYQFPLGKVTVNLAPADLKKDGSGLDYAYSYRTSGSEWTDFRAMSAGTDFYR